MSSLAEYRRLEQQIAEQRSELEKLQGDAALKQEIDFEAKLLELLNQYGKELTDVVSLLDPEMATASTRQIALPEKRKRRARVVKVYRNPLTGEIVESKGGNNRLLGAWKAQFGHEEVESWVKQP
jgi:hypothetical protein